MFSRSICFLILILNYVYCKQYLVKTKDHKGEAKDQDYGWLSDLGKFAGNAAKDLGKHAVKKIGNAAVDRAADEIRNAGKDYAVVPELDDPIKPGNKTEAGSGEHSSAGGPKNQGNKTEAASGEDYFDIGGIVQQLLPVGMNLVKNMFGGR